MTSAQTEIFQLLEGLACGCNTSFDFLTFLEVRRTAEGFLVLCKREKSDDYC
jgi:hypothetical protein